MNRIVCIETLATDDSGCTSSFNVVGIYKKCTKKFIKDLDDCIIDTLGLEWDELEVTKLLKKLKEGNVYEELFDLENGHTTFVSRYVTRYNNNYSLYIKIHSVIQSLANEINITHFYNNSDYVITDVSPKDSDNDNLLSSHYEYTS